MGPLLTAATVLLPMSDTLLDQASVGPDLISSVAAMSAEERRAYLDGAFVRMKAAQGEIVAALGEVERCQDYRDEGATSVEAWVVQRYGLSVASARGFVQVAKKAWDIPHLVGALCAGDISLDKVRAVAEVATPETDREWRERAEQCSVADLAEVARTRAAEARPSRCAGRFVFAVAVWVSGAITIDASCASTTSTGR